MLAIGNNLSFAEILSLWRKPVLLFRELLAVVVLVPLVIILLLKLFNLPPEVMTGLALLAASPGDLSPPSDRNLREVDFPTQPVFK